MLIESLQISSDPDVGLDFGEFLDDPGLVVTALCKLAGSVDPTACSCCLIFHCVPNGQSWFEPYGCKDGLNGLAADLSTPIPQVAFDRLVIRQPNEGDPDVWPVLAKWHLNGDNPAHMPAKLKDAKWHLLVRIQRSSEYIGYFKIAFDDSFSRDAEYRVKTAFEAVRRWLKKAVARRQPKKTLISPAVKAAISSLHVEMAKLLALPKPQAHRALRLLCTFLTSHLAIGFNRIAFLTAGEHDDLYCAYAHGGDCTDAFSGRVQRPLTERAHTVPELTGCIDNADGPIDDPLYVELAARPTDVLRIPDCKKSTSTIAQIWNAKGSLAGLGNNLLISLPGDIEIKLPEGIIDLDGPMPLAAEITENDQLLSDWRSGHSGSAWLACRNKRYFALPWIVENKPLGIFLVDLGYWEAGGVDTVRDVVPRLVFTQSLLTEFSATFAGVSWS